MHYALCMRPQDEEDDHEDDQNEDDEDQDQDEEVLQVRLRQTEYVVSDARKCDDVLPYLLTISLQESRSNK